MKEKCEDCGRYGARKIVADLGPDGIGGGRQRETRYLCLKCEALSPWLARMVERRAVLA